MTWIAAGAAASLVVAAIPSLAAGPGELEGWKLVVEGGTASGQRTVNAGWTNADGAGGAGAAQLSPTTGYAVGLHTTQFSGSSLASIGDMRIRIRSEGATEGPRVTLRLENTDSESDDDCSAHFMMPASSGWQIHNLKEAAFWADSGTCAAPGGAFNSLTWAEMLELVDPEGNNTLADSSVNASVRVINGVDGESGHGTAFVDSFTFDGRSFDFGPPVLTLSGSAASPLDPGGSADVQVSVALSGVNQPTTENVANVLTGTGGLTTSGEPTSTTPDICTVEADPVAFEPVANANVNQPPAASPQSSTITVSAPADSPGGACTIELDSLENADAEGTVTVQVNAPGAPTTTPPTTTPPTTTPPSASATPPSEGSGSGSGDGDGSGSGSGNGEGSGSGSGDGDDNGSGGSSTGGDDNGSGSEGSGSGGSAEETPSAVPGGNGAPSDGVSGAWLLVIAAFGSAGALAWYRLTGRHEH